MRLPVSRSSVRAKSFFCAALSSTADEICASAIPCRLRTSSSNEVMISGKMCVRCLSAITNRKFRRILFAFSRLSNFSSTTCLACRLTAGLLKKTRNSADSAYKTPNALSCFDTSSAEPCSNATSASALAYCRLASFNLASLPGSRQTSSPATPGLLPKLWRQDPRENPNQNNGHDRKVDPLKKFVGPLGGGIAAFFRRARTHGREQDDQKHRQKVLPRARAAHRASLAGLPGRGGTSKTLRAISVESCAMLGSTSRTAWARSLAMRSFAAPTSAAALARASFSAAPRSSSSFFRAVSCSEYTCA